jgi:hypothetical protein
MVKNMVVKNLDEIESVIEVRLNDAQMNIIKEMMPMYGETESEVIKTIIVMFLHEHINKVYDLLDLSMEPQENL